jgi:hypothetical protein
MYKNLETYLDEISHFLSGPAEREEILSEIRSHILEKAEQEAGTVTEAALDTVIATYGEPRRVAEKYLDGRAVIAPALQRHLFRYTTLLFAIHLVFILFAVIFRKSFIVFPFLFIPRLGLIGAVLYLPTAFLTDFGVVALVLYAISRSAKEIKLPWPKFALDLDEVKATEVKTVTAKIWTLAGAGIMLALTGLAVKLFLTFQTIFFVSSNFNKFRPLLLPGPSRRISLIVIAMMAAGTIGLFIKLFTLSRRLVCWVNAISDSVSLVLIGLLLSQTSAKLFAVNVPARFLAWIQITLTMLCAALIISIDLVANVVRLGRKRLAG